jgi:hypothetical protein
MLVSTLIEIRKVVLTIERVHRLEPKIVAVDTRKSMYDV